MTEICPVLYPATTTTGPSSPSTFAWPSSGSSYSLILPGNGEAKESCGTVRFIVGCPDSDIEDRSFDNHCGRLSCPVCYESAVARDAHEIERRMDGLKKAYEDHGYAFSWLDHVELSSPPEMFTEADLATPEGNRRAWSWAENLIRRYVKGKDRVLAAGVLIMHHKRFKHLDGSTCEDPDCEKKHMPVFGLHFHWTGYGWWVRSDTVYGETGGDILGLDGATYRRLQPGETRSGRAYRKIDPDNEPEKWSGGATFAKIGPGEFYEKTGPGKKRRRVAIHERKAPGAERSHGAVYKKIEPGTDRDLFKTVQYELSHAALLVGPKETRFTQPDDYSTSGNFSDEVPGEVETVQISSPYRYLGLFANCKGGYKIQSRTWEIQLCHKCGSELHEFEADVVDGELVRGRDLGLHAYLVIEGLWYFNRRIKTESGGNFRLVYEPLWKSYKSTRTGLDLLVAGAYSYQERLVYSTVRVYEKVETRPVDWENLDIPKTVEDCYALRDKALAWLAQGRVPSEFIDAIDRVLDSLVSKVGRRWAAGQRDHGHESAEPPGPVPPERKKHGHGEAGPDDDQASRISRIRAKVEDGCDLPQLEETFPEDDALIKHLRLSAEINEGRDGRLWWAGRRGTRGRRP